MPGPIATVQLANFRRGLQDDEYLTLARSLGLNSVVDEVLQAIVPRVFSDAGPRVSFPETGEAYEAARLSSPARSNRSIGQSNSRTPKRRSVRTPVGRGNGR